MERDIVMGSIARVHRYHHSSGMAMVYKGATSRSFPECSFVTSLKEFVFARLGWKIDSYTIHVTAGIMAVPILSWW